MPMPVESEVMAYKKFSSRILRALFVLIKYQLCELSINVSNLNAIVKYFCIPTDYFGALEMKLICLIWSVVLFLKGSVSSD